MLYNSLGGVKMSLYTTGEVAKLCDITVRTVQYYDKENIVHPSEISEDYTLTMILTILKRFV